MRAPARFSTNVLYRLIARGAAMEPEHDAIVYLRTALDPAPAVTSARTKAELGKLPLTADIVAGSARN